MSENVEYSASSFFDIVDSCSSVFDSPFYVSSSSLVLTLIIGLIGFNFICSGAISFKVKFTYFMNCLFVLYVQLLSCKGLSTHYHHIDIHVGQQDVEYTI